MVLGSMSALATVTINTINDKTHTFAYVQVFKGTQNDTADDLPLGNIEFGGDVTGAVVVAAVNAAFGLTGDKALAPTATAEEVAKIISAKSDNAAEIKKLADELLKTYTTGTALATTTEVEPGYYLIIDTTSVGDFDSKNPALLQVTKDITVASKTSVPTVEKKVDDKNDSTDGSELKRDSADYDVGDKVPFHVEATVGSNVANFKKYHLRFTDTMAAGLKNNKDYKVYFNDTEIGTTTSDRVYYEIVTNQDQSFEIKVTFNPESDGFVAASVAGKKVRIDYTAELTSAAVTAGATGVLNTVTLKYSNNPNSSDDSEESNGPKDYNKVFTYTVQVTKLDDKNAALAGAAFDLYKLYTADALAAKNTELTAAGKETLVAATEIKYNNGKDTYAIGTDKWVKVGTTTAGANTVFGFNGGFDDGTYLLVETTTPAGYNSVKPSKFTITGGHTDDAAANDGTAIELGTLTGANAGTAGTNEPITLSQDTTTTTQLNTNVINKGGLTLPETGGIGTTIFYVAGSILVLAAAILLITKRRMGAED